MGGGSSQITGYRYGFGLHMGICRGPIDSIVEVHVADTLVWPKLVQEQTGVDGNGDPIYEDKPADPPIAGSGQVQIDQPDIFGGDKQEGGIKGKMDVMMGTPTQTALPALATMLGGLVPAFRGIASIFFDGLVCSNNPYPKPWSFRVRRALKGWDNDAPWYPAKAIIVLCGDIHAMNPAHIIYQCLTSKEWGRGLDPSEWINEESFIAAANTLADECFGLCLKWNRQTGLDDFIGTVIDHIGAVLYPDRLTGKITIRLIRQDYSEYDLPNFTYDSGLLSITDDDGTSSEDLKSEVMVKYIDATNDEQRMVRVQNIAAMQSLGATSSETIDYPGLPTSDLAMRVAQRDLRARGLPLRRFKLVFDRRGEAITPGSVFTVTDPENAINNIVLRAGKIEDYTGEQSSITITAIEDVFGMPEFSYTEPQPPNPSNPDRTARPVTTYMTIEAPYQYLLATFTAADFAYIQPSVGYALSMAKAPTTLSMGFDVEQGPQGGVMNYSGTGGFCRSGRVLAVTHDDQYIVLTNGVDLHELSVGDLLAIGDEIVAIESILDQTPTTASLQVLRGCFDTTPQEHTTGDGAFSYMDASQFSRTEFGMGEIIDTLFLTRTSTNVLEKTGAPGTTITIGARHIRPYLPGNFRLVDDASIAQPYWAIEKQAGDLVMTWAHRNRVTQADQPVGFDDPSITAEAGTVYRVSVLDALGAVKIVREYAAPADTATITEADLIAADLEVGALSVVMQSLRDGWLSYNAYRADFIRE